MKILRLKEVLTEKGVTGKQLASYIGMTETSISRIVKGDQYPKVETLISIAKALDVDIKELFASTKKVTVEKIYVKQGREFIVLGELETEKLAHPLK